MKRVLLLIDTATATGRGFLSGIAKYSRSQPFWTLYVEPGSLPPVSPPRIKKGDVDGIIMRECADMTPIRKADVPVIVSPHFHPHVPGFPNIFGDDAMCGALAANHLMERGFRNLAFIGFKKTFWSTGRYMGFLRAAQGAHLTCSHLETNLKPGERIWKREHDQIANFLKQKKRPLGIFTATDYLGRRVLEVCKEMHLMVPDEVGVLGVGNDRPICELAYPLLSSVSYNCEGAGFEAAKLLDKMMHGESGNNIHIINEARTVVIRQSTDIIAVADLAVAKAIAYIRSNSARPLIVGEIAKSVGLSRRSLERRFQSMLKRTIHTEIRRIRIERASAALLETNVSISELAYSLNYSSPKQLHREFLKEKAIPPGQFRVRFAAEHPRPVRDLSFSNVRTRKNA